ncbi:MAG: dTMP kinase [Candidatus Dadabacteria bacterium]|nr:dTMP kinase [Candidatus Dadabacteria bacterium]
MRKFITFEGVDGSGKSTQAKLLADYLSRSGNKVFLTREPGEGRLGELIRTEILDRKDISIDPYAELCLFCADRAQHVRELILPKLRDGYTVICDRYYDSTLAYQGSGREIDPDLVHRMATASSLGVEPDITFFLSIPVPQALLRLEGRQKEKNRMDEESSEFHRRVDEGYRHLIGKKIPRIKVIEATVSPGEIHMEIRGFFGEL